MHYTGYYTPARKKGQMPIRRLVHCLPQYLRVHIYPRSGTCLDSFVTYLPLISYHHGYRRLFKIWCWAHRFRQKNQLQLIEPRLLQSRCRLSAFPVSTTCLLTALTCIELIECIDMLQTSMYYWFQHLITIYTIPLEMIPWYFVCEGDSPWTNPWKAYSTINIQKQLKSSAAFLSLYTVLSIINMAKFLIASALAAAMITLSGVSGSTGTRSLHSATSAPRQSNEVGTVHILDATDLWRAPCFAFP